VRYFNKNTGDTAVFDQPSKRLEALANWVRVAEEEPMPAVEPDGVLSRSPLRVDGQAPAPNPSDTEPGDQGAGRDDETPAAVPDVVAGARPAASALKAEWVTYARSRAQDSDETTAIDGLTKEQLIDKYGGSN
jgi:hypothetical protein